MLSVVAEGSGLYSMSGTGCRNEGLPEASVAAGWRPALANSAATHSAAASSPGCSDMRPSRPSPAMNVRLARSSLSRMALKPVCRRGAMGCWAVAQAERRRGRIGSERKENTERKECEGKEREGREEGLIALLWHGSPG